jgi:hypothetical protein
MFSFLSPLLSSNGGVINAPHATTTALALMNNETPSLPSLVSPRLVLAKTPRTLLDFFPNPFGFSARSGNSYMISRGQHFKQTFISELRFKSLKLLITRIHRYDKRMISYSKILQEKSL